jgi:aminoglycoside 3-N-acetyltransferase
MRADYAGADVVEALRAVGVRPGDTVFTHSSVGMLGVPAEGLSKEVLADVFLDAFREVLGPTGTWILPTYTYSYTSRERFDPARTPPPAHMGLLPTVLWERPEARRTLDPIFSVIAFGGGADELVASAAADDCFGERSVYARLLAADGLLCNVGIGIHSAFIHHVEQALGVPYRFIKEFPGVTSVDGELRETTVAYNVRSLDEPGHAPYFMRLDADARTSGAAATHAVGRGEINAIRARDLRDLIVRGLERDPDYLVLGELAGRPIG